MKPKLSFDWSKLKNIKKSNLLIAALAGVLLLVIAVPVQDKTQNTKEQGSTEVKEDAAKYYANAYDSTYQENLERQLKKVLAAIDGVGQVEVMITLKDSGETVVEKDITKSEEATAEEDAQGTKRQNSAYNAQESTVVIQEDGDSTPFVSKEVNPQVEGVLIVAQGGQDATVVKNISDAVLALFPIEAHKIKVVKMNN